MHLHAIDQTRSCEQRRIDGVNSTPSSRRSYRYSTASMAWGGQMGRRAADRARSSRRRRGAGGRCPRPFLLRFVAFLRAKLHRLERRLASLQSCLQCSQPAGNCSSYLLRVTAVLCVRTAAHTDLAIVAVGGAHERPRKEPHRQWYDSNATCYAKQQHSTTPEGRYPSQRVAGQTERYSGLASEEL